MADVKHLTRSKPTEVVVDLGEGDTISVVFDCNAITTAWMQDNKRRLQEEDLMAISRALADVFLSWDVTDEGNPFPATPENIATFPLTMSGLLFQRIIEAAVPGSEEGNASLPSANVPPSATSEQISPNSPNGSDTSTSQQPSASPSLS